MVKQGTLQLFDRFNTTYSVGIDFIRNWIVAQVTSLILQTLEAANYSLRKQCIQSAMAAVREMVRVFPMVALYPGSSTSNPKLAVGDPVGDVRTVAIHVYDLHR